MITFRFPTNVSVEGVIQEYAIQREALVGISLLPFTNLDTQFVEYDELDRERGMTAAHNMDADPKIGKRPGLKRRRFNGIPFKETDILNESDILMPRMAGTLGGVIDLSTEIGRITKARFDKNYLRAESCIWQALKGNLSIDSDGVSVDEDFPVQTQNALVDWDELDTATPLLDFMAMAMKFRFTGARGNGAVARMNQTTANWLLSNQNADDIKGFQNANFLQLPYSIEELNKIFVARGLPIVEVYDEGYVDDADDEKLFLEDGEVIVIGKRSSGERIGDFGLTPSAHRQVGGQPAPGFFSIIEVNGQPNPGAVTVAALGSHKNPKIEITGGFYGAPRLKFPRSVINFDAKVS